MESQVKAATLLGRGTVIVGNPETEHVGAHLYESAKRLGVAAILCDTRNAWIGPSLARRASWWLCGHRPPRLRAFSHEVTGAVRGARANVMLTTGIAPVDPEALDELRSAGVHCVNYLTDDPWSPSHRAPWFLEALAHYDTVYTPRRANMEQLRKLGGPVVSYLPFAYSESHHYPDPPKSALEIAQYDADVVFVGGADKDRYRAILPLVESGFDVALYGGYWSRFAAMRHCYHGMADGPTLRKAVGGARVTLGLVRRANRDGHCMRTFEVPAMGGCMLAEDTDEHRELFGADGQAVTYFKNADEMIGKVQALLADKDLRTHLATASLRIVGEGRHSYTDRLQTMLAV